MAARPERESLRVVSGNSLDSNFHAVLLRIAFPPSWKADRQSGEERDPIPQRLDERDRQLKRGEYAGAGVAAALVGWAAYLATAAPVPIPPVPPPVLPVLPVLIGAGVLAGGALAGMFAAPIAAAVAPVAAWNGAALHGAALYNAALAWVGGGAVAAGGGGMAAGVQLIATLGGALGGLGGALGGVLGGAGAAAPAAPVAGAAGAVAVVPVAAAAAGAAAGRVIGRATVQTFEDPEQERQLFRQLVKKSQMETFFQAKYLKPEIWELPNSDRELRTKLWFDMALLPRLASTSEAFTYCGTFCNGKMHGQGMIIITGSCKPVLFGDFENGFPHGDAVVLRDFKVVAELKFSNGVVKQFKTLDEEETKTGAQANDVDFRGSKSCCQMGWCFSRRVPKRGTDLPSSVVFDASQKVVTKSQNGLKDAAEDAYARTVEFVSDERNVYLSYAKNSQSQNARKMVKTLQIDHGESMTFKQGFETKKAIEQAMSACDIVIVILCNNYLTDLNCIKELVTAQRHNKVVIPVISSKRFVFTQFKNRETNFYDVANSMNSEKWRALLAMNILPIDLMSATEFLIRRESIATNVDFESKRFKDDMGVVSSYIRKSFANL